MSLSKAQLAQIQKTTERFLDRKGSLAGYAARVKDGVQEPTPDTPERVMMRVARLAARWPGRGPVLTAAPPSRTEVLAAAPSPALALERIIGTSDLMSITYLERGLRAARTVGRISIRTKNGGPTLGYGTGSLISPTLLLTNNHVLGSPEEARFSRVEFQYQELLDGGHDTSVFFPLDPARFFVTDPELDYTLVAVDDPQGKLAAYGFNRLIEAEGKVTKGESLSIVQHPRGEPKQVALRENRLIEVLENFLIYQTDTAPGSSGSPVFNDEWEIVALHHSGFPRKDAQGNWLTRDGRIYQDGMDDSLIDWIANEGARVSRIVKHLKAASLGTAAMRKLRDACFEAHLVAPSGMPGAAAAQPATPANVSNGTGGPCVSPDGTTTWTIPIQVSVRVGGGPAGGDGSIATSDAGAPAVVTSNAGTGAPATDDGAGDAEAPSSDLREALSILEASRTRRYYDKKKDGELRDRFYQGFVLPQDKGDAYKRLSELLKAQHKTTPPYRPGIEVYPWVDLHPGGKLRSIYSGREYDPEAFIREDFEKERRIERLEARLRAQAPVENAGWYERAVDVLEAAMPYNCEHVVPQSWFKKKEPMRGDLHHLFACESGCNSFRGNIPYFDFSEEEEAFRHMCGRREPGKFEPVAGRGAVARATLYFLLRYPKEVDNRSGEYTEDRLRVLLSWHEQDAVGEYERHRNWAICERQGNRNPLIDFPEWASRIDFRLALGKKPHESTRRRSDDEIPQPPASPVAS